MNFQDLPTASSRRAIFCEFIPRSSEQCGQATFLKIAAISMVNLCWQCGRRGAVRGSRPAQSNVEANATTEQDDHVPVAPGISENVVGANRAAKKADETGDPSRIRTCNPRSRNPLLYPVELWDRSFSAPGLHSTANMKNPLPGQALSEPFSASVRHTGAVDRCVCPPSRRCCATAGCQVTSRGSLRQMSHGTSSPRPPAATRPSPFRAMLIETRRLSASQGAPS